MYAAFKHARCNVALQLPGAAQCTRMGIGLVPHRQSGSMLNAAVSVTEVYMQETNLDRYMPGGNTIQRQHDTM